MKILDFVVLFFLVFFLSLGVLLLFVGINSKTESYSPYTFNISSKSLFSNSSQFYPNMRYASKDISYGFESDCNLQKRNDVMNAFGILAERSILKFQLVREDAQITVSCSETASQDVIQSGNVDYYVAGEGGPTEAINLTNSYYLIKKGRISLFRDEKCQEPKLALHEILHALGFDHNGNPQSVMYPVTNCNQYLDAEIINEINNLYSLPSLPDLIIEKISANKTDARLSFYIVISNSGFTDASNLSLDVFADNIGIGNYNLGLLKPGMKKTLEVQNSRIQRKANMLVFVASSPEKQLSDANKRVELLLNG